MVCGFRRLEDQLKRWNDVAKLIGRAWRARQGLKATLKERSERVQHLDDEFATRELASFASRTFRVEHSDSLDRLPSASAGLLPQGRFSARGGRRQGNCACSERVNGRSSEQSRSLRRALMHTFGSLAVLRDCQHVMQFELCAVASWSMLCAPTTAAFGQVLREANTAKSAGAAFEANLRQYILHNHVSYNTVAADTSPLDPSHQVVFCNDPCTLRIQLHL